MPVEIKELVIRAVIEDDTEKDSISGKKSTEKGLENTAIVQACVAQVLKVLKKQKQR